MNPIGSIFLNTAQVSSEIYKEIWCSSLLHQPTLLVSSHSIFSEIPQKHFKGKNSPDPGLFNCGQLWFLTSPPTLGS